MRRLHKLICMCCLWCMCSIQLFALPMTINSVPYEVDGYTQDGKTFISVLDIYHALGIPVTINPDTEELTLSTTSNKLTVSPYSKVARLNGYQYTLSATPHSDLINVYLPLKDVANIFCGSILYENNRLYVSRAYLDMNPDIQAGYLLNNCDTEADRLLTQVAFQHFKNDFMELCNAEPFDYTVYSQQAHDTATRYVQSLYAFKKDIPTYIRAAELHAGYTFTHEQRMLVTTTMYALITHMENGLLAYIEQGFISLFEEYTADCMRTFDILDTLN